MHLKFPLLTGRFVLARLSSIWKPGGCGFATLITYVRVQGSRLPDDILAVVESQVYYVGHVEHRRRPTCNTVTDYPPA